MKKTMMYMPDEMHAYLAEQAKRRGISMAEVVREAVSQYRTASDATRDVDVSAILAVIEDDSPRDDLAENVDELLGEYYANGSEWDSEHGLGRRDS